MSLEEVEHDSMFEVKVNPVGWRCVRFDALVRKMAEAAGIVFIFLGLGWWEFICCILIFGLI